MLGRGGVTQPNEVADIGDLLELVGDDNRYKTKLQELQGQVTEANRVRELAIQANMKAEENRRAVRDMLEQAKAARAETITQKEANERLVGEVDRRTKELESKTALFAQDVNAFSLSINDKNAKIEARELACVEREKTSQQELLRVGSIVEHAEGEALKLIKEASERAQRQIDTANSLYAEAEKVKLEAEQIKAAIAKKHTLYNEFVEALAKNGDLIHH